MTIFKVLDQCQYLTKYGNNTYTLHLTSKMSIRHTFLSTIYSLNQKTYIRLFHKMQYISEYY